MGALEHPAEGSKVRSPERNLRHKESSASRQTSGWSQLLVPTSLFPGILGRFETGDKPN